MKIFSLLPKYDKYRLIVSQVRDVAEVWVNGYNAGVRCWQPYHFDISEHVQLGKNRLEIKVTNTPGNQYVLKKQDYIFSENWGKVVESGILGDVYIQAYNTYTVKFVDEK
ncbi:MAG TPA: hypothetical protein ENN22_12335 [bacterium]|nr:hypothetical protein [bacterium]